MLGCSALTGGGFVLFRHGRPSTDVRLLFVRLINATNEEQSFDVEILRDDETVFADSYYDVPAYGTDRDSPDEQSPSTHMIGPAWDDGLATRSRSGRAISTARTKIGKQLGWRVPIVRISESISTFGSRISLRTYIRPKPRTNAKPLASLSEAN